MTRIPILTPDQARVPDAVPAFQRPYGSTIAYRRRQERSDQRRGRRDRDEARATLTPAQDDESIFMLHTTWLQALGDECGGYLEDEHRATNAMHAAIDHDLVGAYQQLSALADQRRRLTSARDQITASNPQPDSRGAASDGVIVATARATRDHKARVASATGEVSSIDEQAAAVQLQIVTLLEDRASHWTVLLTRCWELLAHFDRRGATYAGQASKGAAVRLAQTRVTRPQWLSQPAPPAPRPDDPTASPPNPH
jgi:hypothetical protein